MGPNSAPNGDRRLVTGYGDNDYYCDVCKRWDKRRKHDAFHNRLDTGKTKGKR